MSDEAARLEIATELARGSSDLRVFDKLSAKRDDLPKIVTAMLVRGNSYTLRYSDGQSLAFRKGESRQVSEREALHLREQAVEPVREADLVAGTVTTTWVQKFSFAVDGVAFPDPPPKTVTKPLPLGAAPAPRRRR